MHEVVGEALLFHRVPTLLLKQRYLLVQNALHFVEVLQAHFVLLAQAVQFYFIGFVLRFLFQPTRSEKQERTVKFFFLAKKKHSSDNRAMKFINENAEIPIHVNIIFL